MKKNYWILLLIILIPAAFFAGYKLAQQPKWVVDAESAQEKFEKDFKAFQKYQKDSVAIDKREYATAFYHEPLDRQVAKDFISNYKTTYQNTPEYTSSIWIPYSQLQPYLGRFQTGLHDGLRIYFGKIDSNVIPDPRLRARFINLNGRITCIFIPTKSRTGTSIHDDYLNSNDPIGEPYDINELCPPNSCDGKQLGN